MCVLSFFFFIQEFFWDTKEKWLMMEGGPRSYTARSSFKDLTLVYYNSGGSWLLICLAAKLHSMHISQWANELLLDDGGRLIFRSDRQLCAESANESLFIFLFPFWLVFFWEEEEEPTLWPQIVAWLTSQRASNANQCRHPFPPVEEFFQPTNPTRKKQFR